MFERFSPSAKAVLVVAQELANELDSSHLEVGHLLYGCAVGRESTAGEPLHERGVTGESIRDLLPRGEYPQAGAVDAASLSTIGIDVEEVRRSVEATFGPGALDRAPDRRGSTASSRRPPFTTEAKHALEQSLRVALEIHDQTMQPGHVLLGILRLNDEFVTRVLNAADVNVASLCAAVLGQLGDSSSRG